MSKTPFFTRLFGPSPIAPIQEHIAICEKCALEMQPFFEAVLREDHDAVKRHYNQISSLESEADELKKEIRLNLPRSMFLPVSRNNLLEVLQVQDRIANASKDIAGLMLGREMTLPADIQDLFIPYVDVSVRTVTCAREAMDELNDLIIAGFSGREIDFIESKLDLLDKAEGESDQHQVKVRQALIQLESELNPIDVMFLYKIIDLIGDLSDNAQTVGNRMMYLIAS